MHSRVVSQRLGLMKGWTGANRAKGAKRGDTEDRDAKLKCDLCDLEDTRDHFICTCLCDYRPYVMEPYVSSTVISKPCGQYDLVKKFNWQKPTEPLRWKT